MPGWFWTIVAFSYGAFTGSFLNVLIYRMPLGMSVARPASHCPHCNHYLRPWDNIPLVAFLLLGGRCRFCRAPISWRYFGVELLTASLWVALYWRLSDDTGLSWLNYVAVALFASVLIAVIFIDLDLFFIPDELNWVGVALGVGRDLGCLALAWLTAPYYLPDVQKEFTYGGWLPRSIVGALVYGGLLFAVSYVAFLYYARDDDEPLGRATRRFFALETAEPESDALPDHGQGLEPAGSPVTPSSAATSQGMTMSAPISATAVPATESGTITAPLIGTSDDGHLAGGDTDQPSSPVSPPINDDEEDPEVEPPPARLRFSPAFLAGASALLLAPSLKGWALLAFVLPLAVFVAVTQRRPAETVLEAAARFFRADDLGAVGMTDPGPATGPLLATDDTPVENDSAGMTDEPATAAQLARESDQFAREAETGAHGGMGLGDVKLALAIGALLGPGQALLSLLVAAGAGAMVGTALALTHGRGLRLGIPFGPFMALGAIVVLLYGRDFVDWYLRFSGLGG